MRMKYLSTVVRSPDNVNLGKQARLLRGKFSLTEVARGMGITVSYLCLLERGYRNWSQDLLASFEDAVKRLQEQKDE